MSDPMNLTVTAAAKRLGFNRSTVAVLCARGELGFIPAVRPDGSRSRIHKRIPVSEIEAWEKRNIVRSPADLKKAVDGRRR